MEKLLPGRKIRHRLRKYLETRSKREGIPLFWEKYYCSACKGHFGGEVLFLAWAQAYGRKLIEDDRNRTIHR